LPTSNYTKLGWSVFTVPNRVTSLTVSLDGAGSGSRPGSRVTGKLAVKAGQKLYVYCGTAGKANNATAGGAATGGGGGVGGTGRSRNGGYSGGGYSIIRLGATNGTIKAIAGGAGGNSGDGGLGGAGGGSTGGSGARGNAGPNSTGAATGGTQTQGGNGGTSSAGAAWNGKNATDAQVAAAGAGGITPSGTGAGGGGGGGGFHPGGGGQAAADGYAPGGGGGGGSDYWLGLTGASSVQGGGGAGNGSVSITWVTPPPGNLPPTVPTAVKVNNVDATGGMLTKATTSVKISANIFDPDKNSVRMLVRWSTASNFSSYKSGFSGWVTWHADGRVATFTMTGLAQNTHYYVRLYTQDPKGLYSTTYNSVDFWTNKAPLPPTDLRINTQSEGMMLPVLSSATFGWTHNDEDYADYQSGFQIGYRTMATASVAAGPWTYVTAYPGTGVNLNPKVAGPPSSSHNEWVFDPGTFKGNQFYEWMVKTRDGQGLWGAWSAPFSFYSESTSTPPALISPANKSPVRIDVATTFIWRFIDPDSGALQSKADIRWRALGHTKDVTAGTAPVPSEDAWIMLLGAVAPGVPGAATSWVVQDHTFIPEYTYEWQVRTYDNAVSLASGWSNSFTFHAIAQPGAQGGSLPFAGVGRPQGSLGCGEYRVFLYQQGGQKLLGEVTPATKLNFTRVRDDISACTVLTNGYSSDCGSLYANTRSWMHELVVYRDGVRVWEGPITRIAYSTDSVEIEAKDVMAYVYRRIMRAGYNDAYRLIQKGTAGQPDTYLGLLSVVHRAALLITQALAPFDPNVLPYLTALEFADDAQESRIVADWSRTCWEEVDDLAATAGLDYTAVGRRILLWDTHRPIGRLPEMRDGDFSDSPIVTEYGMQLATFFAVTNGSGVVGWTSEQKGMVPYGPIEQLASSYSDSEGAGGEVMTPAAKAAAEASLIEQAKRNISGRWPAPLIVRVPDNTTLSPKANVGFQQLIPGVWLPLRSVSTPRRVFQWQKLDSVAVEVDENGEKVHVVMSPAPNGGNDPDSDTAAEEG
jgi:hypothetical protein